MKRIYGNSQQLSVYDVLLTEFSKLSSEDLEKPAFIDPHEGVTNVNAQGKGALIVKYNPDCWNRTLPKTAIQFVSMKYVLATQEDFNRFLKNNHQLKDYVGMFLNGLPVERLGELI
jgi:hypothetical protein